MFGQWMGDNRIDLELEREEHQMIDKQKEAIEYFKKRIDICMENANICDDNDFDEEATYLRKEQILIETVLNLIQTQQAEIEKKDKESHFIQSELDIANAKIIELKRIIDLMSEQLTTPLHSKAWVKEYYERKVENGN